MYGGVQSSSNPQFNGDAYPTPIQDSSARRQKRENGLVDLTKKFIDLLKTAPEQTLDLNAAVERLEV